MNRTQRAALKKQRHDRQVARRLEKKRARVDADPEDNDIDLLAGDVVEPTDEPDNVVIETGDIDEDDPGDDGDVIRRVVAQHSDEPEEAPSLQKDMGYADAAPPLGATSWDELDSERAAQEQAHEVRMTSYDVENLVRNILDNPVMDPGEKASAIQAVGKGFQARVDTILTDNNPDNVQKDLDLLELEALIAYDNRHLTIKERMGDWIAKATLTAAGRNKLSAGQFALVVTRGGKKIMKYPIHDKAHVRNALARAAQQIKAGGQGAADAKMALPKIHAAAKRMGIGVQKSMDGTFMLQKDANGAWRWVGLASNNYKDLQGDIVSKEAHQEFVNYLDANPDMAPLFMTWHTPGTARKNRPDYWAFEKGFLILSGVLEDAEAAALFKAQTATDLGMSIQGFGLRDPKDPRVIVKYRAFEVSDLPLENAANPFTDFSVIVKEVDMNKKEYLATLLGSNEAAEAYLAKAGMKQEVLDAAGVEKKENDPKPAEKTTVSATADKVTTAVAAAQAAPADAKEIIAQVFKELDVEGLNAFVVQAQAAMEKVPVLEDLIKSMQTGQDEALAAKISPPAAKFAWMKAERASASEKTVAKPDDEVAKRTPGLGENWLSEVTNTVPIEAEPVHL